MAGRIQCSAFTCSWPVTGPRPCLDELTIPSRRLPGDANTIRAPVRPQAGPPGPFKSTKRRGAALTLTRHTCTSTMQRPAQHSTPTTTDALSVSPASSGRTADTAVPPLSTSGNVTSPAPTTIQQQAAFLNSAHGPATCNAGGVSATLSLIATQTPEPESRNAALALQSTTPAALPNLSASGLPIGNSESVDKRVSTSVVPSIAEVLPSITSADDLSTEMDFTASQVNKYNTPSPEGSWNIVSANRKPASTARTRSELITVGIQLPPATLTPKLPLYDLLSTVIAAANLSPKTSAEVTLQAKPAQSLVFLKTHSPLTAHLLLSLTSLELNDYCGEANPDLDRPFTLRQLEAALATRSTHSAPERKVLCALRFFATGSFQLSIGREEHIGMSQPAVSNTTHEVTEAIITVAARKKVVDFPLTTVAKDEAKAEFARRGCIPGVLACVDGTLVAIRKPEGYSLADTASFMSRKGYYALNVMIVSTVRILSYSPIGVAVQF
ncbi:hypothetical protein HPB51_005249 [Rhipicephalus microplus]|uniref:DDE Tnp4 domain-containing protein n=1 Tax=Rhipicephalus microplus TaxID=6941 RepID=A0A9J6DYW2_RHIMP|nr:hypothetical protein HPB51_005249 [Rhipicephalus microplus]